MSQKVLKYVFTDSKKMEKKMIIFQRWDETKIPSLKAHLLVV